MEACLQALPVSFLGVLLGVAVQVNAPPRGWWIWLRGPAWVLAWLAWMAGGLYSFLWAAG